ncbi:MAG: hypothetical protein M3Z95_02490 [Actinomycetota bacterium]|nr:hypothetical protein [Actinomycetota bacterium]
MGELLAAACAQRLLSARHIRVLFVPRHAARTAGSATVHHHLRYIAAGVIVAVAAIGAGLLLYRRRAHGRRAGRA